jgi:hypothetical protein
MLSMNCEKRAWRRNSKGGTRLAFESVAQSFSLTTLDFACVYIATNRYPRITLERVFLDPQADGQVTAAPP